MKLIKQKPTSGRPVIVESSFRMESPSDLCFILWYLWPPLDTLAAHILCPPWHRDHHPAPQLNHVSPDTVKGTCRILPGRERKLTAWGWGAGGQGPLSLARHSWGAFCTAPQKVPGKAEHQFLKAVTTQDHSHYKDPPPFPFSLSRPTSALCGHFPK